MKHIFGSMNALICFGLLCLAYTVQSGNVTVNATCPSSNETLYTDLYDFTYEIDCGAILTSQSTYIYTRKVPDFTTCLEICSQWNFGRPVMECNGVQYNDGSPEGSCLLLSGNLSSSYIQNPDVAKGQDIAVLVAQSPQLLPAPVSFMPNCSAPGSTDNFNHYTDPDGVTYFILCGAYNLAASFAVAAFSPPTMVGCIHACSEHNRLLTPSSQPAKNCTGVFLTVRNGQPMCFFDTSPLGEVLSDQNNEQSAYITISQQLCSLNTAEVSIIDSGSPSSAETLYTTPENDTFIVNYLPSSPLGQEPIIDHVIVSLMAATPCDCVEQCSLYNIAYPNTTLPCLGAEYNQKFNVTPNCFVKSA